MRIPKTIVCEGQKYHIYRVDGEALDDSKDDFTYADVDFQKFEIRLRKGVKKTITEEGFLHELIHLCEDNSKRLSEKTVDDFARRLYDVLKRNNLFSPNLWNIPQKLNFEAHCLDIIEIDDNSKSAFYDLDKSMLKIEIKKGLKKTISQKMFFIAIIELCDSETHPIKTKVRNKLAKKMYALLVENNIIKLKKGK